MSYLSQPKIHFSGQFRADPSTVNNTPDNFNPNNNFPPLDGIGSTDNVQTYWNPNGTGQFLLDCTITDVDESLTNLALVGMSLRSTPTCPLHSAKIVDLDPMQQNVSELWALKLQLGGENGFPFGDYHVTAYTDIWIQVIAGQGDYAGSGIYQSTLTFEQTTIAANPRLADLLNAMGGKTNELSIAFVLRSFNGNAYRYLFDREITFPVMASLGIPEAIIAKLEPLTHYYQHSPASPNAEAGLIPSTHYTEKLIKTILGNSDANQYRDAIQQATIQPYIPSTPFDFTWGQVFGTIGPAFDNEPAFMPKRMLAPVKESGVHYAPAALSPDGNIVNIHLGNALPSTQPAGQQDSYVAAAILGKLTLCYFKGGISVNKAVVIGEIEYVNNDFFVKRSGIASFTLNPAHISAIGCSPLGVLSTTGSHPTKIILHENENGLYLRANQFVFRMNPGTESTAKQTHGKDQAINIHAYAYGQPLQNVALNLKLKTIEESASYTNSTLGTGGSSGLANMGHPQSALSFPSTVNTDTHGIAKFILSASNPGQPRGYIDGQIYFLNYGFADTRKFRNYRQSPDDIVSIQVYTQVPEFNEITWENFVKDILGQYGKLYPIMNFIDFNNEQSVIDNAAQIFEALERPYTDGAAMPVTRDLSASRLALIKKWLAPHVTHKQSLSPNEKPSDKYEVT